MAEVDIQGIRMRMSSRRTTLSALAVAAVLAGGTAQAEIPIAMVGPITGDQASIGEQMRQGAELATADINAAGGVLGQQLTLSVQDDACDPRQAVAAANTVAGDGAVFVVGHYCSATSIAASEVYNEERILEISPGSTNPLYTERGLDNVFRVCGRDDQQAKVAAEYVARAFPGKVVGITNDTTSPGTTLGDVFQSTLHELGITEAARLTVTKGDMDFSSIVTRLKEAGVQILYHAAYHKEAALLLRQAREQGMDVRIISNDDMIVQDFWTIVGEQGNGSMFTFQADPRIIPEATDVVARFKAAGYDPAGYTLYSYAAVQIFAQAATAAGTAQGDALIAAMRGRTFDTVLGPIAFDEKGDPTTVSYRVYEWKDGTYDYAPE
jgi:branched-chain amino acid transport system substrate-binding protein